MKTPHVITQVTKFVNSNAPEIMTIVGITGVASTAYLTAKATYDASHILHSNHPSMDTKQKMKRAWKYYIPAVASGAITVVCIYGSTRVSAKRTAAAVAAYSITERAFSEYKEKVIEEIGKNKEQKVRDSIAQDKVTNNPSDNKEVIIAGTGHILCCELYTHRYFRSDMESLRKAQNDINARIVSDTYVSLDEFYELLELAYTSNSSNVGWDSDKLVELSFSTVISDNGEPCLAFDYNYIKPIK